MKEDEGWTEKNEVEVEEDGEVWKRTREVWRRMRDGWRRMR